MDLLSNKESSANAVSDKIKDMLYTKSADKVDGFRSNVADNMFNSVNAPTQQDVNNAPEVDAEDEYNPETPEREPAPVGEAPGPQ